MSKLRIRLKFLIVRLSIAAGLTVVVILIVRHSFAARADQEIDHELRQCTERLRAFVAQEDELPTGTAKVEVGSPELSLLRDKQWVAKMSALFDCDFALTSNERVWTSSLNAHKQGKLAEQITGWRAKSNPFDVLLGDEEFRASMDSLGGDASPKTLIVLKSWEAVRQQQTEFTRLMALLAAVAMIIGFVLVLRMSDTFARPLGNLVEAVRALEKGDFNYPVVVRSGDELAEVSQAFDQMRTSLKETQQHLLRTERLATIGQMASSISHDLRHPLTAIVANAEFLSDEKVRGEQRDALYQEIRLAVEQMNDLVESLLEFSRGREAPRLVSVDLQDVTERAIHAVRARLEFHQIAITVNGASALECELDPLKIERALLNLLLNACQAVAAGSGRVEVS